MRLRRPSWFAVLLTLAGVVLFVRLGVWQLHRAAYKEQLLAAFSHASSAPLLPFAEVVGRGPHDHYRHVQVNGSFVPGRSYVLDDQALHGVDGVDVFLPFRPAGRDRVLLVNMGFLPRQGPQQRIPGLPPVPAGPQHLTGLYAPPPLPGFKMGGNQLARQGRWPKLTTYLDLHQVADDLGTGVDPGVLLSDPDPAQIYLREWTPTFMPPARHQAYAFQWFSFAAATLVIFFVMHRRKNDEGESPP